MQANIKSCNKEHFSAVSLFYFIFDHNCIYCQKRTITNIYNIAKD